MKAVLLTLEALGLFLAFLDLFELSQKIQAWIDARRRAWFLWFLRAGPERIAMNKWFQLLLGIPLWLLFFWILYSVCVKSPHTVSLMIWWTFVLLGPPVLLFLLLPLFYNVLLFINRTGPGKTVGKVSFLVAVSSSLLQHLWEYWHPGA